MRYLIVGLGNIGTSYAPTRHNIGFMVIDQLLAEYKIDTTAAKFAQKAEIKYKGRRLHLIKPDGYINQSGKSVNYWMLKLAIAKNNLLVIVDDLALPFGQMRLRARGSHGGHNGLRHIEECLQGNDFPRLRVGIGNDFPKGKKAEYVLSPFTHTEQQKLPKLLEKTVQIVHSFSFEGLERAMNIFNAPVA